MNEYSVRVSAAEEGGAFLVDPSHSNQPHTDFESTWWQLWCFPPGGGKDSDVILQLYRSSPAWKDQEFPTKGDLLSLLPSAPGVPLYTPQKKHTHAERENSVMVGVGPV